MRSYHEDNIKEEFRKTKQMIIADTTSKREKEINLEIDSLYKEREEIKSRKTFKCTECGKRTQLKKLTVVKAHYYIRPYSCTGGDYWAFSNEYYVICPKCDVAVRAYTGTYDESSAFAEKSIADQKRIRLYYFIDEYYKYFGERLNMYEKSGINSIDLDKLRAEKKETEKKDWY